MSRDAAPARIEIRTCKEIAGIARQRPDRQAEMCMKCVHKGLYRTTLKHAGEALYPTNTVLTVVRESPARLAGTGEDCHLQGNGGASA